MEKMDIDDMVARDLLEAWVNDEVRKDTQWPSIEEIMNPIVKRLGWDSDQESRALGWLKSTGLDRSKILAYLGKKTLYKMGLPVLLAQELRRELKTLGGKGQFQLPIVGMPPSVSGLSILETVPQSRVRRTIDGKTFEYDRLCPHKAADLTCVHLYCVCISWIKQYVSRLRLKAGC